VEPHCTHIGRRGGITEIAGRVPQDAPGNVEDSPIENQSATAQIAARQQVARVRVLMDVLDRLAEIVDLLDIEHVSENDPAVLIEELHGIGGVRNIEFWRCPPPSSRRKCVGGILQDLG
jgi:hypothetical protein